MKNGITRLTLGAILSWLTLTGIVVSFNAVLAQSGNLSNNAANKTAEYFRIDYNYTNFADCSPACKDITVHYDSATNELSLNDWMRPEDVVIIKHLTDEQEKILESSVLPLQFANFNGSGVCRIGTIYCETSSLTLNRNGTSHTALWSFLSENIVNNLNNANKLILGIALSNQSSINNMTSNR